MVTKKVNFSILNPSASKEILIQNIQLGVNDIQLCPYDFIMYFFLFYRLFFITSRLLHWNCFHWNKLYILQKLFCSHFRVFFIDIIYVYCRLPIFFFLFPSPACFLALSVCLSVPLSRCLCVSMSLYKWLIVFMPVCLPVAVLWTLWPCLCLINSSIHYTGHPVYRSGVNHDPAGPRRRPQI